MRMIDRSESVTLIGTSIENAHDPKSYSVLWRHVLAAMLTDACSPKPSTRREVYRWSHSRDLEMTCAFAGVNEEWAQRAINDILEQTKPLYAKHLMLKARRALLSQDTTTA